MLRLLIGTGVLLMAVGFGAAGWQYWQSLPADPAGKPAEVVEVTAPPPQSWLISPTGGLVQREDVLAYLAQGGFVPGRTATITRTAPLTDLLAEGEKLPEAPYLEVLADIRAPRVAETLCEVLRNGIAAGCAVNSARVIEGSVDQVMGTARFRIELVYRLKAEEAELPDLAAHVLKTDYVRVDLGPGAQTVDAALTEAVAAAQAACQGEGIGQLCRIMRLSLDWAPGGTVSARAQIGWLDPLPDGMFVAPPLDLPAADG